MLMVFVYNKLKNVTVNNKSVWLRLLYEGLYISMTCLSKCSEVGCYYCENLVQNNTKWKLKMWNVCLLLLIFEWKCIRISEMSRKNLEIFWSSTRMSTRTPKLIRRYNRSSVVFPMLSYMHSHALFWKTEKR